MVSTPPLDRTLREGTEHKVRCDHRIPAQDLVSVSDVLLAGLPGVFSFRFLFQRHRRGSEVGTLAYEQAPLGVVSLDHHRQLEPVSLGGKGAGLILPGELRALDAQSLLELADPPPHLEPPTRRQAQVGTLVRTLEGIDPGAPQPVLEDLVPQLLFVLELHQALFHLSNDLSTRARKLHSPPGVWEGYHGPHAKRPRTLAQAPRDPRRPIHGPSPRPPRVRIRPAGQGRRPDRKARDTRSPRRRPQSRRLRGANRACRPVRIRDAVLGRGDPHLHRRPYVTRDHNPQPPLQNKPIPPAQQGRSRPSRTHHDGPHQRRPHQQELRGLLRTRRRNLPARSPISPLPPRLPKTQSLRDRLAPVSTPPSGRLVSTLQPEGCRLSAPLRLRLAFSQSSRSGTASSATHLPSAAALVCGGVRPQLD